MEAIDTLLHASWVIPLDQSSDTERTLEDHAVAVNDGDIIAILPSREANARFEPRNEHHYPQHVLMPGLINSHTHSAMNLFRGLADDLPLMDWLQNHIWPAESRWVNEDFVHCGSELAIAEMIRGGTTCFNDMYFFPDVTARVAQKAGMRANVGLIVLDFPTIWASDAEEYIDKGLALHDTLRDDELVTTAFAPHAPYTVSDAPLEKLRTFADELELSIHMHVHETADEIAQSLAKDGKRPLQRLDELGLLSPALNAVHMTQLEPDEIEKLAETASNVLHCPESNMKLASGICPLASLLEAGVNVALGTDGAASNNDLDMFGEMRSAALLGKIASQDASRPNAYQVLEMATINGARALGISDRTGSLEHGKRADIIAVRFDTIESAPVYDPVSHLVYSCSRNQVNDVWIDGRHVMKDRVLTTIDTDALLSEVSAWQSRIATDQ